MYLRKYCVGTLVSVVALSCAVMGTSSSISAVAYADEVTAQEEATAPEPETQAPQPETPAPQPETQAPQPETQAPQPETQAPQPETQAPQPETQAPQPETQAPQTEAASNNSQTESQTQNHSVAIPDNPKERRLNQTIVDAHEFDGEEGLRVSVNGSEGVIFQPEDPFINVITAVSGGAYKVDYVKPGTEYRKNFAEAAGNVQAAFNRIAALGSNVELVFYSDDGTMMRFAVTAGGSFENKNAFVSFTSSDSGEKCTVTYDAGKGRLSSESLVCTRKKGEMLSHFDVSASKDDLHFCGWYYGRNDDAKRVYPTDVINKDVVIYAHYTDMEVAHVNYDLGFSTAGDGDLAITDVTVPEKDGKYVVNNPPKIKRDGYKIKKWVDADGNDADFENVKDGMTYRIIWEG